MSVSNKKRILASEIIEILVAEKSIDSAFADEFVKVLLSSIEESLISQKSVKIKGLGRLKVKEKNNSLNIVYKPDQKLETRINAPFAHFKPVPLNVPNFEKKRTEEVLEEKPKIEQREPLTVFQNQALEIKELLTEIGSISDKKTTLENKQEVEVEKIVSKEEKKEEVQEIKILEVEEQETDFDTVYDFSTKKQEVNKECKIVETFEIEQIDDDKNEDEQVENENDENDESIEETDIEEEDKGYFWFFIVLGLILASFLLFIISPKINKYLKSKKEDERLMQIQDSINNELRKIRLKDSLNIIDSNDTLNNQKVSNDKVQTVEDVFNKPRKYTENITVVKFSKGQSLANLSRRYYGNYHFWVYVYEANQDMITNPNAVPIGSKLNIPKLDKALIDKSNPKCLDYASGLEKKYLNIKK